MLDDVAANRYYLEGMRFETAHVLWGVSLREPTYYMLWKTKPDCFILLPALELTSRDFEMADLTWAVCLLP